MSKRLTTIVTKTGDKGQTRLGDGTLVDKDNLRVEAYGTVDELNSLIGVLLAEPSPQRLATLFTRIQHDLFELGGELAVPGTTRIAAKDAERLEAELTGLNHDLKELDEFILPGGTRAAAVCHLARTVCRRAERRVVALARQEEVSPHAIVYVNRLSDLLFVAARALNNEGGESDVLWKPKREG